MSAADTGVAGECNFLVWREDADAIAGVAPRRCEQERGFHEIVPAGKTLHRGTAPVRSIKHHTKVIAASNTGGKHIQMQVTDV